MGAVVNLPSKQNNNSLTSWLNNHAGCNVDKMINGNKSEQEQSIRHFEKETLIVRSNFKNDKKRK